MDGWFPCFGAGTMVMLAFLVVVVGVLVLNRLRMMTGHPSRHNRWALEDEAKLMEDLHQGLVHMEGRIEALETLLVERERREGV